MIKAIETVYKGHRFRSRLEARWGVFFDTLGLEWEYETEGFEFENQRYLPDFWLPTAKMWIEVKPRDAELPIEYTDKLQAFSSEIGQPLIVLCGAPYRWEFDAMVIPSSLVKWFSDAVTSFSLVTFFIADSLTFGSEKAGQLMIGFIKAPNDPVAVVEITKLPNQANLTTFSEAYNVVDQAYLVARQARFGKDGRG